MDAFPWGGQAPIDESAAPAPAAASDAPMPWAGQIALSEPKTTTPFPWYSRAATGLADPMVGLAQLAAHATPYASDFDKLVNNREQNYQDQAKAAGMTGLDYWRLGGNFASPVNFVPVAGQAGKAGLAARALSGAEAGAFNGMAQPVTGAGDFATTKAEQAGVGATLGTALGPIGGVVAGARSPDVQMLENAGMALTPAQSGGRLAKATAAIGAKLPVASGLLADQQKSAIDSFTPALLNQVLAPIGAELPKGTAAGHDAYQAARGALSGYYDDLMPRLSYSPSTDFLDGLSAIEAKVPATQLPNFHRAIGPLFTNSLSGDALKGVDSDLATFSRRYIGATSNPEAVDLGYAVSDARNLLHDRLAEINPDSAAQLKAANRSAAMLRVAEDAVSPTSEGKVTPSQVLSASARSSSDPQFAQGRALLQPFAEAAQRVVGSNRGGGNHPLNMRDMILADALGAGLGFGVGSAADNSSGSDWMKYGGALAVPALMLSRPGAAMMRSIGPAGAVRRGMGGLLAPGAGSVSGGLLGQ